MLIDLKPSGRHYMEHFHWAGGVPRLMHELARLLDLDARDGDGKTLRDVRRRRPSTRRAQDVIRTSADPICADRQHGRAARQPRAARRDHQAVGGEPGADDAHRPRRGLRHRRGHGRAHRFARARRRAPTTCSCCATPARSARPACPRPATCRSRRSSRAQGVKDMVRISDARMSGTAFGTIVLHLVPEAAARRAARRWCRRRPIRLDVAAPPARAAGRRRRAGAAPAPTFGGRARAGRGHAAERGYARALSSLGAAGRRRLRLRLPGARPGAAQRMNQARRPRRPGRRRASPRGPR